MQRISKFLGIAALAIGGAPTVAIAQDGAFSMGGLTGTLSQDHVTQSERARAGGRSSGYRSRSTRQAQACAGLPNFRAQYGADHPKVVQLTRLCANAGY